MIKWNQWFIYAGFPEPEYKTEDDYIYDDGDDLCEEDESGLVDTGVSTYVTELGTKEGE